MIFLTGANGFLGSRILAELVEANVSVRCISRKSISNSKNVEWIKLDLLESNIPDDLLKGCSHVIHCAGVIKGIKENLNKINYISTKRLLRLSHKESVKKFIFISSIDVLLFDSEFAKSKRLAENAIIKSNVDWVIIRPSQIFGLNDNNNFALLNKLIQKIPIILLPSGGKFKWEPVYVDDLAIYIVNLILNNNISNEKINVVGPEILSFYDIICQLEKFNRVKRLKIPFSSFVITLLQKITAILLGVHKSHEIFLSFNDKIVPEHGKGRKIRLTTNFSQIFKG